jgi:hypothetical protein
MTDDTFRLPECKALRIIYMLELKRNFELFKEWADYNNLQWERPGQQDSAQVVLAKLLESK